MLRKHRIYLGLCFATTAALVAAIPIRNYFRDREIEGLFGRFSACLIGDAPLGQESLATRIRSIRRAIPPSKEPPPWPKRCAPYARKLEDSAAVHARAQALVAPAHSVRAALDSGELVEADLDALWSSAAHLGHAFANSDVPRPPAPLQPLAAVMPFLDAPKGTKLRIELDSLSQPRALWSGKPSRLCRVSADYRLVRCSALDQRFDANNRFPSLVRVAKDDTGLDVLSTEAGLVKMDGTPVGTAGSDNVVLANGVVASLIWGPLRVSGPEGASISLTPGSRELAIPALKERSASEVVLAGSSVFWLERAREPDSIEVMTTRIDPSGAFATPSSVVHTSKNFRFVGTCRHRAGQVVVLGAAGSPERSGRESRHRAVRDRRRLEECERNRSSVCGSGPGFRCRQTAL